METSTLCEQEEEQEVEEAAGQAAASAQALLELAGVHPLLANTLATIPSAQDLAGKLCWAFGLRSSGNERQPYRPI